MRFLRKTTVCQTCKHVFEAYKGDGSFPNYCPEHREEARRVDLEDREITQWVKYNRERLLKEMREEQKKQREAEFGAMRAYYDSQQNSSNAQQQQQSVWEQQRGVFGANIGGGFVP